MPTAQTAIASINDLKDSLKDALQLALENLEVTYEGVKYNLRDDENAEGVMLLVPAGLDVDYDKYPAELDSYAVSPCQIKLSIKTSDKALKEVMEREGPKVPKKTKAAATTKRYTLLIADDDGEGASEELSTDDPDEIRKRIKDKKISDHLIYVVDNRTGKLADFKY